MGSPCSLAVIGCGDVAMMRHLPAIAANPDVSLAACCDALPHRAATAAQHFGAGYATTDVDRVLGDEAIDAVVVATPPWVSPRLAIQALQAGKDVLCEKPLGLTLADALAVREAEQMTDRFVQVGFVLRHGPLFGALRRWIAEGRLGAPLDMRISVFDEVYDPSGNPEHYQRILATLDHGAPCIHDGAHTMDHLHFLLGEHATRIASWGRSTRPEFPRPNLNLAVIEFASGSRARVEIGWFLPTFPPGEWSIVGPQGLAWFDQEARSVTLETDAGRETVALDDDWFVDCFRHQLATFVEGVRTRVPPEPGTAAGIASLALCLAFERGMSHPFQTQDVDYP
ncbi:MAG: Gfo/Idh/MocA family oxidoreductase [Thermomicrobiales bacterium]